MPRTSSTSTTTTLKALKASVDQAKSTLTAAQEAATKLQNAATAAETVKSTKSALEELLFTQQLGDSSLSRHAGREGEHRKEKKRRWPS